MEAWQTSVEARLGQLHGDLGAIRTSVETSSGKLDAKVDNRFFWLLGTLGVGFITLAGMMIAGYLRLADSIAAIHH